MAMTSAQRWLDRPTLVTGACGLVGSWLVKSLVDAGADVICLVRDWSPTSELVRAGALRRTQVVAGDIRDQPLLERVLGEHEVRTVFHLAAQTSVVVANRNPASTWDSNVNGTVTLLEACRRSPVVSEIVVASSDKAYGEHEVLPYNETHALRGLHPYDASKASADLAAQSYAQTFGLPVAITRCGNFFGGGDLNWNRLIPGTIRSALRGTPPVIRSDGSLVRDYFYVEDGARAYMALAEALMTDRSLIGEAFNFSIERPLSVLEVTRLVLAAAGSTLEPDIRSEPLREIRAQWLDASKARTRLGWRPAFSFESGLERTVAWYRDLLANGTGSWSER